MSLKIFYLKKSIREPRYLEQKCRLQKCEINNIVLIVEGSTNVCDRSLEQAIISNRVDNDFLVHPTLNKQGKAKFLQFLTKRLEEKCCKEEVFLFEFIYFKNLGKGRPVKTGGWGVFIFRKS